MLRFKICPCGVSDKTRTGFLSFYKEGFLGVFGFWSPTLRLIGSLKKSSRENLNLEKFDPSSLKGVIAIIKIIKSNLKKSIFKKKSTTRWWKRAVDHEKPIQPKEPQIFIFNHSTPLNRLNIRISIFQSIYKNPSPLPHNHHDVGLIT